MSNEFEKFRFGKEILKQKEELEPAEFRRLKIIAERVAGDFGMKVELGKPGEGSFFDPKEVKIVFDPEQIKENLKEAEFTAAHEGGHRAITRGPESIKLKKEIIKNSYGQLGFSYLLNCLEDPADNNWIQEKFAGLRENVKETYDEMLEKENVPLGLTHPEVRQICASLGYVPKFVFFGSEIIRNWHQKRFSKGLDKDVEQALEKTKENFEKYYQAIPSIKLDEKEIIEKAQERFSICYQEIWPEFKKIVEMDINQEKIRQMLEKMAQDILDQLEKDIKEELKNKLEQGKKAQQEKEKELKENLRELEEQAKNLEKEVQDLEKQEQKTQGKEKERLEKELQEKKKQIEENQKRKEKISKDLENLKEQKEKGLQPIPMDQISEKLKEKLKEFFDQLPENKKQEFEEKAKENLEDLEDTLNEKMEPKLNEDNPESHQERKEREKKEEEETIKKRGEEKAVEEARIKAREKMEKEQTVYQKYYKKVKPLIDDLYKRLLKIFIPQRHPRWEKGYPSGGRLDLLKAMQFEADKTKYQELWERKTIPRKIDYRFSLLVDLSGSMEGEKIKETFKGVIVLAEVLNHLGIKFNILGFQDIPISFKDFRENLDRSKRNLLSGMLKEVKNENPGGNNRAEYNSDGFCLQETAKELEKNKGKDNFLIVLSDGLPVPDKAHSGEEYELSHIISQIKKRKIIKLIGLGLGPETEHVKDYYPVSLPNIKVEDLPKTLAQLLEDMIRNPQKY